MSTSGNLCVNYSLLEKYASITSYFSFLVSEKYASSYISSLWFNVNGTVVQMWFCVAVSKPFWINNHYAICFNESKMYVIIYEEENIKENNLLILKAL